jgi:mevalonate kinase
MTQLTASAPGKLMLSGSYAVVHGYPCLVTAVDQRLSVRVAKNGSNVFHLDAPDVGMMAYSKTIDELGSSELPKAVRFIEVFYKNFLEKYPQDHGIEVTTKSDFSSQFGFGSSSAVTVAFAKALLSLYEVVHTNDDLFDMCYRVVTEVQGVGSGFDIAAAIWGGTIVYTKQDRARTKVSCKNIPIVVGYTGMKADTPTLIRMVDAQLAEKPERISSIFEKTGAIVDRMERLLEKCDWESVGKEMRNHQELMRELGVSSPELDNLIAASQEAGATGATLSGAGGGDCMVAVVDDLHRQQVEAAIVAAGGVVIPVGLQANGVVVEKDF